MSEKLRKGRVSHVGGFKRVLPSSRIGTQSDVDRMIGACAGCPHLPIDHSVDFIDGHPTIICEEAPGERIQAQVGLKDFGDCPVLLKRQSSS
jgi:hypothetical protein